MITASLSILFESDRILIVDKPAKIASAKIESRPDADSAEARLESQRPGETLFLLHRLDSLTTGCLAFAKTRDAYEATKHAWKTNAVRKFYRARIEGEFRPPSLPYDIEIPIARLQKTSKRMKAILKPSYEVGVRGEPLPAHTRILEARAAARQGAEENQTELGIEIFTGVMHQIRVHLSALGHPIIGDPIYGAEGPRLFLHAERIVIALPGHEPIDVRSPLPW